MPLSLEELEAMLPTGKRTTIVRPEGLVYMLIAPPKWGKTTWFCNIPGMALIPSERGHKFQDVPTIYIDAWNMKHPRDPWFDDDGVLHMTMYQFMTVIVESDKYNFLCFDTADQLAKKCSDYFCEKNGWTHPTDGGDYGKGWDVAQNSPFRQLVGKILATGRGIGFTTHSEVHTTAFKKGAQSKRETSLPGGIFKFLHTQADVILHGKFGQKTGKNSYRDRILRTEGDEETLAGNRSHIILPEEYIVDPKRPWDQWCSFFKDKTLAASAEAEVKNSSPRLSVLKKKH